MAADSCDLLCLDLPGAEQVRSTLPTTTAAASASALAKALADPNRLRVAAALAAADELCVCDLAWVTSLAQNLVSHHVRSLRSAGLASSRRDGRMVMYALTPTGRGLLLAVLPDGRWPSPTAPTSGVTAAGGDRG